MIENARDPGNRPNGSGPDLVLRLRQDAPVQEDWDELADMVRRAAVSITAAGKYPCPFRDRWWPEEDAEDLAQEFWVSGSANKVCQAANDDRHLRNLVWAEVRNKIIGQLRQTGIAALHDRMSDVLQHGGFVWTGDAWRLPNQDPAERYQGDRGRLLAAAYSVQVDRLRVKEDSQRESSFASREQLAAMFTSVLVVAGAPVPMPELEAITRRRLGLHDPPLYVGLDTDDDHQGAHFAVDVGDGVVIHEQAMAVWDALGRELQPVFMHLVDHTVRSAADALGIKRNKAHRLLTDTKERLRALLEPVDLADRVPVLQVLMHRGAQDDDRTRATDDALHRAETP